MDLLWKLLQIDSPSGDEGPMVDWLVDWIGATLPEVRLERLGDSVIAYRGTPTVAIFAHIDTTGFTLGYKKDLIPIGGPHPAVDVALRCAGSTDTGKNRLKHKKEGGWRLSGKTDQMPGSRWVYASEPQIQGKEIVSPYLDNRAGVWAALQVLLTSSGPVAVAFTAHEEDCGQGALVCARHLYEKHGITEAIISDITWDTAHVHCGQGVAISLRDGFLPRRSYVDRTLAIAEVSGIPFQREVESSGGSDGGYISRSAYPIDWVFVGAPEKNPHTSVERVRISDLNAMVDMLSVLVLGLQG